MRRVKEGLALVGLEQLLDVARRQRARRQPALAGEFQPHPAILTFL